MEAVAELPTWQEVLERNPANRERMLALDRQEFIATMERWMLAYPPNPDQVVPGLPNATVEAIAVPTLVFRSSATDLIRARAASEQVAALVPVHSSSSRPGTTASGSSCSRARSAGSRGAASGHGSCPSSPSGRTRSCASTPTSPRSSGTRRSSSASPGRARPGSRAVEFRWPGVEELDAVERGGRRRRAGGGADQFRCRRHGGGRSRAAQRPERGRSSARTSRWRSSSPRRIGCKTLNALVGVAAELGPGGASSSSRARTSPGRPTRRHRRASTS